MRFDEIRAMFPGTGSTVKCPAHLDGSPSLSISEGHDGRTLLHCHAGCSVGAICEAVGLKPADLFPDKSAPRNNTPKTGPVATAQNHFRWQSCVAAFTDGHAQKLADWRGLSIDFVRWLHGQGMVGIFEGKLAIANHGDDGAVVSAHIRLDNGKWVYKPSGQKTAPLVFGDSKAAGFVLTFESQWDAFAIMDLLGWHISGGLPDTAILVTRGAGNGKLVSSQLSPDAICYAFRQNDQPTHEKPMPAADVWLADIVAHCGCNCLHVVTPEPHADANDWTRAGATKADLDAAIAAAKICHPASPAADTAPLLASGDTFDRITSDVRGDILGTLADKNTTPSAQRREICERVIAALNRVGRFYFHAELRDFESALFFNRFTKRLERLRADAFASWLSEWLCVNRADSLFKFIIAQVETEALSGNGTTGILPESFWASRPGAIYISSGDGQLVKITADGVQLADNGADGVLFPVGRTCQAWPLAQPQDIFQSCGIFRDIHATAGHASDLLRAWVYSMPSNPRSKPPICFAGEIGSGKTRLAKAIAEFYGLPFIAAKVEESEESNFWPSVDAGGIFTLDNADTKCRWLADALANAATDGCSQRRRLYTNAETITLRARAWLAVTTANPTFAADSGLADRLLLVRMARRDGEATSDTALTDEILANRAAGLSHLAETLRAALADTAPTPAGLNQRHPDFSAFAVRIGRALNREAQMIAAMKNAEADKSLFCLENDAIGAALLASLSNGETFTGTAGELREKIIAADGDLAERLSAKRLGKRLSALWPHLKKQLATAKHETGRGRMVIYTLKSQPSGECGEFQMPFS